MENNIRGADLKKTLGAYTGEVDAALDAYLKEAGEYDLYKMMRYFLGFLDEHLSEVEAYAGKRFRPALVLLVADAYGKRKHALDAALTIELFHNFSLIHDDIEDGDAYRRGRPTVWKLWGINHGINTGDAQHALVAERCVQIAQVNPELAEMLTRTFREVIEGQFLDFTISETPLTGGVSEADYMEMITKKTSVLVGASAEAGARAGDADENECKRMREFGLALGRAYQIVDDVRSVWSEESETGKAEKGDVHERKRNLPLILSLEALDTSSRERLCELYEKEEVLDDGEVEEVAQLFNAADAKEKCLQRVRAYVKEARDTLEESVLPQHAKESLGDLVTMLIPEVS